MLKDAWEFNVLGLYNFNQPGKLALFYDWLATNHETIDGDVAEAGVFRGKTLLATALYLKQIGSSKKVVGFDSFSGFPPVYHKYDKLSEFKELLDSGRITQNHYDRHKQLLKYRSMIKSVDVDVKNISSSEEFEEDHYDTILKKAAFLGLDNIELVNGTFEETMTKGAKSRKFCAASLDCDLYASYRVALPYFWDRMSSGGMLFLDEYYSLKFAGARIACDEFFSDKDAKPQRALGLIDDYERWFALRD